jgi:hypothetical protein
VCQACGALAGEVTVQVMLAAAERELILAQADAGQSVPHATRPLSAAEKRAKMRFKEIDDLQVTAAQKAAKLLAGNAQVYVMAVIGAIFGAERTLEPDQFVEEFDRLARGEMPADVAAEIEDATGSIAGILATVFAGASLIAIGEARRQGAKQLPDGLRAVHGRYDTLARAVALHPWTRLTSKLQTDLLTPRNLAAPITRDDVETTLKAIPLDGATDLAKQAIHTAHGQGRHETMQEALPEPQECYASELLDGETCARCAAVDGKEYDTLAEGLVEYETGGYGACLGGARCRGTLVSVYGYAG